MLTQKRAAAPKIYSIHVLPNGAGFAGRIEAGLSYQFAFMPKAASLGAGASGKLVLTGDVKVKSPAGRQHTASEVTATLLATQGSITGPSPMPRQFSESLKPPLPAPDGTLPLTDWTGYSGSIAVMYLKLSPLEGRVLGVPADLSAVQLNARLYPTSEIERDLHWLYSALLEATQGEHKNERLAADYINAINRILSA
ncbi:MAG TPA: hypothetical protein VFY40_02635 [Blastocatellia bacterium]|nr:hypothetical protein [Blastocatellia bacterium]